MGTWAHFHDMDKKGKKDNHQKWLCEGGKKSWFRARISTIDIRFHHGITNIKGDLCMGEFGLYGAGGVKSQYISCQ